MHKSHDSILKLLQHPGIHKYMLRLSAGGSTDKL